YVTPFDTGWENRIHWDHEFTGKAALASIAASPPRTVVTLEWNAEDIADGHASHPVPRPGRGTLHAARPHRPQRRHVRRRHPGPRYGPAQDQGLPRRPRLDPRRPGDRNLGRTHRQYHLPPDDFTGLHRPRARRSWNRARGAVGNPRHPPETHPRDRGPFP